MKKTSLRLKTANFLLLLVACAFIIGIVLCAVFSTQYFVGIKRKDLSDLYLKMNHTADQTEYDQQLLSLCEKSSITLLIKDPAGEPVFFYGNTAVLDARLNDMLFGRDDMSIQNRKILAEAPDYTLQIVQDPQQEDNSYIEMWGFLNNGNSFIARSSYTMIQNNIRISLTFFAIVCAILLVLAAISIYFIIGYYSKPLERLTALTQKINEGDFDIDKYEYKHWRQDEIGILGENITTMSERLEKSIAELKTSNLNLENELKAKTELEEARKKYMSDVSHELKTPIALISGYAEGLKEGISVTEEDRDYYCDVIIDEAEKMNLIIKRLSTLNQLEEGKSAVVLERFNVVEVINGFLNTMSMIIEDAGANVYFDSNRTVNVWSDEFLFEEVLVNYFNNALHYLDEEKKIKIFVERLPEQIVRVTVVNTGPNIPEDELEHIWVKFYKVDKARTREYGGSGLGLSIVKAVADSLHQKCGVYNLPYGVAFWIELEAAEKDEELPADEDVRSQRQKTVVLPIWKKTTQKATQLFSGTTKILDRQVLQKAGNKPHKRRPKKKKDASDSK